MPISELEQHKILKTTIWYNIKYDSTISLFVSNRNEAFFIVFKRQKSSA